MIEKTKTNAATAAAASNTVFRLLFVMRSWTCAPWHDAPERTKQ
jgi:hypothetical protein